MEKNLCLIEGAEAFSKGEFDGVALENGCLVLEQTGSGYLQKGCYTSQLLRLPAFRQLVSSWNADTPAGTYIEVQARVLVEGQWSRWLSFGQWSPFIRRASFSEKGPLASVDTDLLQVDSEAGSKTAQLRVYLYTDSEQYSPQVRLLGVTVRPLNWEQKEGEPVLRQLYLPAYSQLNRDPAIGPVMCSAVTIAALVNRWGQDVLPEEVARICYDHAYQGFGNWSFSVAAAGCLGFRAYVAYLDLAGLRREIYNGYSVGVSVRYTYDPETAQKENLPYLEGASGTTKGHLMAVHGFCREKDVEYVLVNDSYADSDDQAPRRYRLDQFLEAWQGRVAYIVHPKQKHGGWAAPQRVPAQLTATGEVGSYLFEVKGRQQPLSANFSGLDGGTLAYTIQDGVAYATTAHKKFHYLQPDEKGGFSLPAEALETPERVTIYAVGPLGKTLVAERKG